MNLMNTALRIIPAFLLWFGLLGLSHGAEEVVRERPSRLNQADIDAEIAKVDSSDLDSTLQDTLRGKFSEVRARLADATEMEGAATGFREALSSAPLQLDEIERQNNLIPSPETAGQVDESLDAEVLRKRVDGARNRLAEIDGKLESAEAELAKVRSRPADIIIRLPEAQAELGTAAARLKAQGSGESASLSKVAAGMMAKAEWQALSAEVDMLKQEQLSQSARESLCVAKRELLQRQRSYQRILLAALSERFKEQMASNTKRLDARIATLNEAIGTEDEDLAERLNELRELIQELRESGVQLESMNQANLNLAKRHETVRREYRSIREQADLGSNDGALSQILMRELRRLPSPRPLMGQIEEGGENIRKLMLSRYIVDEKQREQRELLAKADDDPQVLHIFEIRAELLEGLSKNYRELVGVATRLGTDRQAFHDLVVEFQKFLTSRLFWQRSSPLVGAGVFADVPEGLAWSFGHEQWTEFMGALRTIPLYQPLPAALCALLIVGLVVLRPKLIHSLENSGKRIRKISTDRYIYTLRAFLISILLALPVPIGMAFVAQGILSHPGDSEWVRGFGQGLMWASLTLFWVLAVIEICRPGGLGEAHLGWKARVCEMFRKNLRPVVWLYIPFSMIESMSIFEESAKHFDSVGRMAFVCAHLVMLYVSIRLFHPTLGVFSEMAEEHPSWMVSRLRWLWYGLAILIPTSLMVLALIGYVWTSLILNLELQATMRIVIVAVVFYGLLVRWFTIRQRRIALEETLEARRARREQNEKGEEEVETPDFLEVSEEELQLDSVVAQTRKLLRLVVGIGAVIAIWILWTKSLPLDRETSAALASDGLTWFTFVKLALLIPIAVIIVRNLPGLMDLAGLRSSGLDAGTRFALITISQYVVSAAAVGAVFELLNLDWSQFGWIAAALSVGLGFGLQEVVANFVCGIILLFERPIRIGDVVSLGNVTGTVTRIQMRATTITDWDRKDFVVPNKEFITGSLMNWTLSSPVNRIVIPVGVAYGTNTQEAREILLEVAAAHSNVMEDPKPIASFEEFADSTLNLVLRCYLPNMDNRLRTRTELLEAIDQRFKAASIEIAFPQQDLHLRSADVPFFTGGNASSSSAGQ